MIESTRASSPICIFEIIIGEVDVVPSQTYAHTPMHKTLLLSPLLSHTLPLFPSTSRTHTPSLSFRLGLFLKWISPHPHPPFPVDYFKFVFLAGDGCINRHHLDLHHHPNHHHHRSTSSNNNYYYYCLPLSTHLFPFPIIIQ